VRGRVHCEQTLACTRVIVRCPLRRAPRPTLCARRRRPPIRRALTTRPQSRRVRPRAVKLISRRVSRIGLRVSVVCHFRNHDTTASRSTPHAVLCTRVKLAGSTTPTRAARRRSSRRSAKRTRCCRTATSGRQAPILLCTAEHFFQVQSSLAHFHASKLNSSHPS